MCDIDTGAVMRVLEQDVDGATLWMARPETASRVRQRIEKILDFAKVCGYRDGENPARWRGHLDNVLPARSRVRVVEHLAALRAIPNLLVMRPADGANVSGFSALIRHSMA